MLGAILMDFFVDRVFHNILISIYVFCFIMKVLNNIIPLYSVLNKKILMNIIHRTSKGLWEGEAPSYILMRKMENRFSPGAMDGR